MPRRPFTRHERGWYCQVHAGPWHGIFGMSKAVRKLATTCSQPLSWNLNTSHWRPVTARCSEVARPGPNPFGFLSFSPDERGHFELGLHASLSQSRPLVHGAQRRNGVDRLCCFAFTKWFLQYCQCVNILVGLIISWTTCLVVRKPLSIRSVGPGLMEGPSENSFIGTRA